MGTLWHLKYTLILFCISVLNTTGIRQRPTGGLRTWDPETAYLTRCDFNNNSRPFCDWTQPCNVNQGVWIRTKHDTPTDGTGPDGDYPDGKGYFIYQEASNLIPFDTNRLESPDTVVSEKICIDFWYYMFGSEDMNELRVLIQDSTGESVVWSRKGNQSALWKYGAITHTFPAQRKIKVIFEAVRGLTEYGDTALDNVRVRDGSCEAVSTPVPPTPTPTESTPPPVTEAICSLHGDPHYYTFDKQRHDFMGTCTYTLSKLCESNSSLPYFNVEVANEHRGGNTRVSYVQYVDIDLYGYRINLGKNRVVKVDGVSQVLPLTLAQGVNIAFSGQYVVVTTDFGLNVKFDGNHRAEITLPSTYMSKVCGICGNYNGHKADDFLNPDGEMETNSASLGNSWQVYNDSRCLPDDGHTPNCTADEKHMIQSNEYCGLITEPNGPFQNCHSVVDPQSYSESCQYDLCELHLNNAALCQNLQAYADVCQAAGVQLTPWRNATFCPLACSANSHYEPCAAACPATCVDPIAPYNCNLPCVEGCVCDSGYLLYNDRCVPSQQCGCWHNGQHYPVGSEFWTDNTCSSKCTCPARGSKLQCSNASCPAGQYCGVQDGKPQCLEHSYGTCHVHGDPHYNTFDKVTHNFMGNCTYTLAKVCSNSTSLPYFNVEAKNEHRGNTRVSYVREVLVEVYGKRIAIVKKEKSQVLVNNVRQTLPVSAAGGAITVSRSGRYIVLETDFNLRVSYDTDHSVEVKVPTTYFNLTCGMCGNFNNRREDDYMMPDGQQAADSNALGESWQVPDSDSSCGVPIPSPPCSAEDEKLYRSDQFCGMLTARPGSFERCHAVINPQSYFETCFYDLCALNGGQEFLCAALEAYADACQAAGVTLLPWRNATFCPVACPPNSYYNPCTSACPATCLDPLASKNCSRPCVEGCECNNGFVISGGQCVSLSNCGCLQNGKYYEKGESFWQTDCAGQCICAENGTVVCNSDTCEVGEVCKVQNGLLGCYPLNPSTCHIFGDPHYITFDGRLYHFQGNCNYTVVEICTNSSERFSVTTRNEHRGNPSWTALNSVAVTLKNLHIVLEKNKETYVNGVQVYHPVDLNHGARIATKGHYVVIDTSLGFQVKFDGDQELFILVDESHKGQLCGLCGTFNDNQLDDFLKPDKVLEQDPNKFGDSWLVKDDNRMCNPVTPYFESCVYDLCATEGNSDQFCKILEAYAAACDLAGVNLGEWRKDTICASPTACNMSCTFDVDFCEWEQAISDNFDWIRHKGPTPTPDTGPSHDHTTGGGYYIYLQGSKQEQSEVAHLVSPVCSSEGPHCFRFWYHMYGAAEAMALRVYVVHKETSTLEWKDAGNKGDRWNLGEITVHSTGNMQIVLEGMIGEDFRSDIALDDLSIEKGYCTGDVIPTTPGTIITTPSKEETTSAPMEGSGTCVVEGDPHYHTFDKQLHHFMGTCTYTLSKLCESNSSLPYFNVEAANEHRGGNTRVSYVRYVDVDVAGQRIRLGKGGVVTVNGVAEILPCTPSAGVQVSSSGFYTVVTTDFGLRVKFDGNHRVEVTLPSTFGQKVCGMCGNYNGMAADDFLNPEGVLEPDSTSLGNSWQVSNDSSCSAGPLPTPACNETDKQVIASSRFCGLLTDTSGPFQMCHAVLSPSGYFDTCFYDLCELGLDREALCKSLQSYADACQSLGVKIPVWRNATFCPITCPANSHYEPCAAACPATCVDPMAPVTCNLPCVEGCVCDSGYLLYNDRCVPSQQCGCWHNGQHYPVGSEFWTDNTCSSKCTCPARGSKLQCSNASCPAGQYCGVQDGKPQCLEHSYGICHVHGDPHYNTFDKVTHNFMGNCTYTLAKVCSNSTSLLYFNVEAKNEHRGNTRVSYVREVLVEVYGERIAIVKKEKSQVLVGTEGGWHERGAVAGQGWVFLAGPGMYGTCPLSQAHVNNVRQTLPVSAAGGAITVSRSGRYIVLETDFNLRVSYDTDHSVEVKVPTTYFNLTCGMCGNFNNRREDDYMMPDGQQAADSNALGESWQVPDSDSSCGVPIPSPPCSAEDEKLYRSDQFCGMLTARPGSFERCHAVINPQSYFETCFYDLCALNGGQEFLCAALEAYADACQAAGVTLLPWRNATFCPLQCPANSYYDPCMTGCPATCVDRQAPQNCSKPCMEGCACTSGFLLSGDTCVPEAHCGCLFEGNYYSVSENPVLACAPPRALPCLYFPQGESSVNENCTRQCRCETNGQMVCSALSCGEDEVCKIQNGQRGCYPADTALCHIYGDPHYSTFDGKLHHFQGSCNYTVVTGCDNSSVGFSVTTRNEHRGSQSWTALNSVALSMEGLHIALRKNKAVYGSASHAISASDSLGPGTITVKNSELSINGALASLPASPAPGVTISLSGSYVRVSTKLGLQLQFSGDHELLVKVSEKHKGELCGLCGTYTGSQQDDFMRPDGVVVPSVNDFGASWLVLDDEWPCDPAIGPPVSCSPSEEEAANKQCAILTQLGGPFQPCHAVLPPKTYFESCVYDQCATGGSTEQFCNDLGAYAAACAEAGVALGDWSAGTVCAPPTDCNFTCTFDYDFCEWVQADYSSIDWIRNKGPTPTQNTGPSSDHTTGANAGHMFPGLDPEPFVAVSSRARAFLWEAFQSWESEMLASPEANDEWAPKPKSHAKTVAMLWRRCPCPVQAIQLPRLREHDGYYIYLQGSNALPGFVAHLVSPVCSLEGPHCFRFWYHMYGAAETMALRVYVSKDEDQVLVWSSVGNHGDRWNLGEITLNSTGNMQIILEGEWGEDIQSDVALDDLSIEMGSCAALSCARSVDTNTHNPLAGHYNAASTHAITAKTHTELRSIDTNTHNPLARHYNAASTHAITAKTHTELRSTSFYTLDPIAGHHNTATTHTTNTNTWDNLRYSYWTCVVEGDPHYHTFDKQLHHFMGTCTYTLSKLCESNSSLPYFSVEAANEHRGGNTRVSYVRYVDVDVAGQRIRLGKGGVVTVNGVAEILPCTPSAGVQVSSSGFYTVVTTDFGLRVKFDGNHRVEVTLPSTFGQKVCGMCGNYNGMAADDFLNPEGVLEPDSTSLGNSWQVSNDSSCSAGPLPTPACNETDKQVIASSRFCGLLTDTSGPFQMCHAVLSPSGYFDTCFYDLCELGLDREALCKSLQSYADACQSLGVKIPVWRNATFCPITCPANSHYEPCAAACPATCVDPMAPVTCNLPCVEGCVCDSGYLLYNDRCVPSQQCGCWHNGQHYPVGSEFWTDNTCSSKCTCPARGSKLQCSNASCPAGQYCGVQDGKPQCLEHSYGICHVHGDPHYNTFDKVTHNFMGNCTYTLAKVCSNSTSLPYFNVEAKNEHRGNTRVSYVREVLVEVYGERIAIVKKEKSQVLVNNVRQTLPVSAAGGAITVSRSGRYIVLETDFNLRVSYDTDHSVEVKVPTTYFNLTCGMCGNFNNRREDDYMMPDGQQAADSNALGESWQVPDSDSSCGVPIPSPPCSAEDEKLYRSDQFCGMLTARPGSFERCHAVINPQSYFETCFYDLCALNGGQEFLCAALEAYADACQAAGVTLLPWRNATFCPLQCPANSYYDPCMTGCPATCVDRQAPQNCSKPCMEGCACTSGFLLSGDTCVPEAHCGCLFEGNYYSQGESSVNENCTRQCRCETNGQMVCSALSCGEDEVCKIQNGQRGCYPADTALCHIYGDPHYSTFDGKLHHFQGSCNYTVVTGCDNSSVGFSVTTRNEHRGSQSWTALNSVALSMEGLHIALRKNKAVYGSASHAISASDSLGPGTITVKNSELSINGALASLPASPAPGVTISLSGSYVRVSTKLGLQLQFSGDHELLVKVSEKHKGELCGLCGTYTGSQQDDFMRPDGVVVPSVNDFGASWLVLDDEWPCDPAIGPPVSCSPSEEEAANKQCAILTQLGGPFQPCHAVLPPKTYFESCVYDQCATGGSTEQFCNDLGAYAAACAEAGVALGDWSAGTVCAPPTDCNFTCTFDYDFCEWVQADYSSIDWIRNKGPTPTQNTGPSSDHTTGANAGHMFPGLDPEPFVAVSSRARAFLWEAFQSWESEMLASPEANDEWAPKPKSHAKTVAMLWRRCPCPVQAIQLPRLREHDGYYIYLQGSNALPGFVAHLVSPVCSLEGPHCFRFWYHMYGAAETMALRVYVSKDEDQVLVWSSVGNHGDRWNLGEITLNSTGNVQIILEGEWGEDIQSDVALDDLSIEMGSCAALSCARSIDTNTHNPLAGHYNAASTYAITAKTHTELRSIDANTHNPLARHYNAASTHAITAKTHTELRFHHKVTEFLNCGGVGVFPCSPKHSGRASCSASGDPHYNTFDHRVHHFMGNCTYTLSKVCNVTERLPYFDVSTTNEHRGANTKVSYVKSVQVEVYGNQISLLKNKKVNVNGSRMNLPVFIEKKISIQSSGGYVLLETDFGLWVRYDGNHYAEVSVPSSYRGLLCGLCGGNYNGDPNDDNIKPNGDIASGSTDFGQSWLVPENNTICSSGTEEQCDPVLESEAKKNTACGMITDPTGIFKDCHTKVPPENFFENCVYDVCFTGGQATSLCYGLQAYAESCINAGICIEWRNATLCPMSCPGGSIYKSCGTRCPSTCLNISAVDSCSSLPVEGCFCKEGYVLSGDKCVLESSCGCVDQKKQYHQLNESWFTSYPCTERCICKANNTIVCTSWECGVREECSIQDGVLGCHSNGQATCQVAGDPHYFTFDGMMYTFVGTCTYTLVEVVNTNSVIPITILGKNEDRGLRGATYLKEVYIDVYGVRITLQKSQRILLNNERVYTPVENRLQGVSIGKVGRFIVVETDFGVIVKYDGNHHLEITLPQSYFSKVHGMCGNFNDNREDDLSLRNGTLVSVTQFGNSWKVEKDSDEGCLSDLREDDVPPCTAENKPVIESQCNVLKSDKFKACHNLVKPEDFIQICIYDMCQYDGMKSALCDIVQVYVDTCRNHGVTIKWRNSTFCPLPCTPHSHYTDCVSICPSTCNDIFASSLCEKTEECTEGCECDDNYVLSNGNCVPLSNCGCRDDDNNYYSAGETWITPHCTKRCQCQKNGVIKCKSYSCDSKETCVINNGKHKCNPTGFGKCRVMGDPHYITFDGLVHHFQGKYTYILAQTIPDLPDTLTQFSIEGMNYPLRQSRRITYLKEILINVYNHTVRFRQNKQLVLDGVRVRPPAHPHEGIRIYQRTTRIYLETDFGLYLSFDGNQNADIKLANTYRNRVEGLCGDFDGRYRNDFTNPDGVWVKNVNVFGESWKVPLKRTTSRLRRDVSSKDESEEEPDPGLFQGCNENELGQVSKTSRCQILTDSNGPFLKCHSTVSPDFYFTSCLFDMCVEGDEDATLCHSLEEYVLACQQQGVSMEGWRQQTVCGISCPANSNYSSCMSACPASCNDLTSPSECESPCVEGCECLPGYVLSDFDCVPYKQCGCTYLNKYYEIGEIFTTDDCSQRCQCTESSTVSCSNIVCGSDEICGISNYSRGCYRSGPCMPNPCKNDGVCSEITNSTSLRFYCECSELYTGPSCEAEKIAEDPPTQDSEDHTVVIVVGVVAGVVVIIILISSTVYLYRRKRKRDTAAKSRDSSLKQSRHVSNARVYEQDYGCIVNTAFDQNESRNTYL
ncbi:IgGFc-binding protein-like [Strix uralensis]|uniref:IgGFc-binding protein-like n=1 Tax=Strix uralensis TaxID=36305 RepID=UPI003DA298D0